MYAESLAPLNCGQEIIEDTTLDRDLTCRTGPALVVTADGVTVDLGGHTVFGDRNGANNGPGIVLREVTGVTVRNGTVQYFGAGVVVEGGSGNVIENLTVQDNIGSAEGDYGDGIVLDGSSENRVSGNTVQRNGPFSGISMLNESQRNEIRDNVVADNSMSHLAPQAGRQDMGIRVEGPGASDNVIEANTVTGSGADGIVVLPTCLDPQSDPPCVGAPANEGNRIIGNASNGNGRSGTGDGIRLFSMPAPVAPTRTTIQDNVTNDNATNGISVDARATNNTIRGNRANGNGRFDGNDGNTGPACDRNTWEGNDFGTANHPCVSRTATLGKM